MNAQRPQEQTIAHGGRLDEACRRFPHAPKPWVDLSTGVNPLAYPLPTLPPSCFTRLPDDDAFAACESAARIAYGVRAPTQIVIGAGAQSFIQLLPRLWPARRVKTLGLTYAEHAASWTRADARVDIAATLDDFAEADVGVIVNPNNPDGRRVAPGEIAAIAARLSLLVVDESFMDFTPAASVAAQPPDNVIVLRSFGKAYGLPGVRLGFALCGARHGAALRAALGPWAVSGPALTIGAVALADVAWRARAGELCAQSAARLDAALTSSGFDIVGGASLFRLAAHPQAPRLYAALCEGGVLTRAFAARPEWLRFGLPGDEWAWRRLASALEASHA